MSFLPGVVVLGLELRLELFIGAYPESLCKYVCTYLFFLFCSWESFPHCKYFPLLVVGVNKKPPNGSFSTVPSFFPIYFDEPVTECLDLFLKITNSHKQTEQEMKASKALNRFKQSSLQCF